MTESNDNSAAQEEVAADKPEKAEKAEKRNKDLPWLPCSCFC
ncbi:hypothetical protein [Ruminococcus sp.]|nr:hypothetical protein [Ruminococcus sp.]